MLSRTADQLFWMARYVERAENTARLLDVNLSTSLLPQSPEESQRGWRAMLGISELLGDYDARYSALNAQDVLDFMVQDPGNESSIYCALQQARENARIVRGSLTTEVWETHNDTWLELQRLLKDDVLRSDPQRFFEWVKFRSHLSRGVTLGTMLKDDAFLFIRLGTFLERGDNTARLLDVKFHGLPGAAGPVMGGGNGNGNGNGQAQAQMQTQTQTQTQTQSEGQAAVTGTPSAAAQHGDFYYWAAILRSVSAFEIYRKVYRDVVVPARVAELLILHPDMPRSLASCMNEVCTVLERIRNSRSFETERRAGLLRAELQYGLFADIEQVGLHDFLTAYLARINDLGSRISQDFLVPLAA